MPTTAMSTTAAAIGSPATSVMLAARSAPHWIWPLATLIAVLGLIQLLNLDLVVAERCFDANTGLFPLDRSAFWRSVYFAGLYPAGLLCAVGCSMFVWGTWGLPSPELQRGGLFLVLHLTVGVGLIVNVGFKQNFGRPRPKQLIQFGGDQAFHAVGALGTGLAEHASFPSGHAAAAFYTMSPGFLLMARRRRAAGRACFAAGLMFGMFVGASRIVQGGHFLSDVVASSGIIYFTGVALFPLLQTKL